MSFNDWFGLVVGNSRWHWARFENDTLVEHWHTPYLKKQQLAQLVEQAWSPQAWQQIDPQLQLSSLSTLPEAPVSVSPSHQQAAVANHPQPDIWVASVVQAQIDVLAQTLSIHTVQPDQIPLEGRYPTLGLDRILNLWGASLRYGWPIIVIDAGTALTLTAGHERRILGGLILPGLTLQARALSAKIAALPEISFQGMRSFPSLWATSTAESIQSGILYTTLSGIENHLHQWWCQYPTGTAVFTGGDGELLYRLYKQRTPVSNTEVRLEPNLMYWGLRAYRRLEI
ncbi:MAG: pantothenate kinase [Cyanobacteria bacterium P01_A01_bin.114]